MDTIADRFCTDTKGKVPLRFGRETWLRSLLACQWYHRADPFRLYLEHCAWDEVPRLAHWPAVVFDCCAGDPLVQWFGQFLFLGPTWRTFEPGTDLHETPVLIGPQDAGKSSAVRWALPQTAEARRWFSDGLNLAGDDQTRVEALIGRVLVEASELAGSTRAELVQERLVPIVRSVGVGVDGHHRRPLGSHRPISSVPTPRAKYRCDSGARLGSGRCSPASGTTGPTRSGSTWNIAPGTRCHGWHTGRQWFSIAALAIRLSSGSDSSSFSGRLGGRSSLVPTCTKPRC